MALPTTPKSFSHGFAEGRCSGGQFLQAMQVEMDHVELGAYLVVQILGDAAAFVFLGLDGTVQQLFLVLQLAARGLFAVRWSACAATTGKTR